MINKKLHFPHSHQSNHNQQPKTKGGKCTPYLDARRIGTHGERWGAEADGWRGEKRVWWREKERGGREKGWLGKNETIERVMNLVNELQKEKRSKANANEKKNELEMKTEESDERNRKKRNVNNKIIPTVEVK
jgi:hypothetical protein